jgi:hypothetical protein
MAAGSGHDETRRAAGGEAAHAPLTDAFPRLAEDGGQIANARETRQGSTPPHHQFQSSEQSLRMSGAGLVVLAPRKKANHSDYPPSRSDTVKDRDDGRPTLCLGRT